MCNIFFYKPLNQDLLLLVRDSLCFIFLNEMRFFFNYIINLQLLEYKI